jgi:hypothetical protein
VNRLLALVATALVASACASGASGTTGAGSPPSRQPAGRPTTTRSIGAQTPAPTPSQASDDPSPSPQASGHEDGHEGSTAGEDDLRTFAYATTDETALAGELTSLTATVVELQADLVARDLDASKADARTLLDQAETLGGDAEASEQRQRPLEPADPDLAAARGDAIDAFGLTAEYASSVTDIADAVLTGQLADLPTLVRDAAELAGTSDDLTQAYADLNAELAAWAQANPADAARALAGYGTD